MLLSPLEASGRWAPDPRENVEPFTCSPSHLCFHQAPTSMSSTPCERLRGKQVLFCGDSYIRHAYEGLALVLSGNYSHGALLPNASPSCADEAQFDERGCRLQVSHHIQTCAALTLRYDAWCELDPSTDDKYDWIVWGFGNHPVDGNYNTRNGIHNAVVVRRERLHAICGRAGFRAMAHKVIVLNNHYRQDDERMTKEYPDSTNQKIAVFNHQMQQFLHEDCGITRVVDTYAMTRELVQKEPQSSIMTSDGVHWGRVVNVVKAWMVLHMMAV